MRDAIILFLEYVISPLLLVFALNCFNLNIPYSIDSWAGAVILLFLFNTTTSTGDDDE